jgi:drug/metabolite transporter (DMT)-like permease
MDILVKVTDEYALGQILFFRSLFGFIPIFFLIPRDRLKNFYKTQRIGLHFYRSVFGAIAMAAIFIALRNLQLAETVAMTFAGPIFVTIFSIFFLNEKVRATRWSAVIIGFIGVIFISRPGFNTMNYYYIFPIIFCLGFAAVCIFIRKLTLHGESIWLIAFYFTLVSGLGGLATLPFGGWLMPTKIDFILLILIGLFGSVANLLLTQSYKFAEVSLTTPLKYLALLYAIVFGFFIFKEMPSSYTIFGAGLIVVSSLIIFTRERQLKKTVIMPRQQ